MKCDLLLGGWWRELKSNFKINRSLATLLVELLDRIFSLYAAVILNPTFINKYICISHVKAV